MLVGCRRTTPGTKESRIEWGEGESREQDGLCCGDGWWIENCAGEVLLQRNLAVSCQLLAVFPRLITGLLGLII